MSQRYHMVVIEPEGFAFVSAGVANVSVPWSAVREVAAYKRDLLTTDEVRLRLDLDIAPFSVEVSEEMEGFDKFKSAAEKRFQFPQGWWSQVLQPAFATNARVLFSRG
jgi:hypothetical protein